MQDGRAPRRNATRRLVLACLTSVLTGILLGLAAPASAVVAPVLTGFPDGMLTGTSATWSWTADGDADIDCQFLSDGVAEPESAAWSPCASGVAVQLPSVDGDYALVVRATVRDGEELVQAISDPSPWVRVDRTAPELRITRLPDSPSTSLAPVYELFVEAGSRAVCTVNGPEGASRSAACGTGDWAADLSGLPEGAWLLTVLATDLAGNPSTVTASEPYVLDVAPAAPAVSTLPSPGNDATPPWSFVLPAGATATCRLTAGDGAIVHAEQRCEPGWAPPVTVDGTYTARVVLHDAGGSSHPGTATYTYDGTAPATPAVGGPSGRTANPRLSWTFPVAADETAVCTLWQNGTALAPTGCTSPHQHTASDGVWGLEVVLVDRATNQSLPGRSSDVEVDTTPPPAPSLQTSPTSPSAATSFTWNWQTQPDRIFCRVVQGETIVRAWSTCLTGTLTVPTEGLLDGPVTLELYSADDLGNASVVVRSTVVLDRLAPAAPTVTGTSGAGRTPTAQWLWASDPTDTSACLFFDGGTSVGSWSACTSGTTWDLPKDGAWSMQVRLTDAARNQGEPGTSPTYVLDRVAPPAPTVTGPSGDGNTTNVVWTVSGEPGAVVTCRIERDATVVQDWGRCSREVARTLSGDGAWRLRATLTDAAGNTSPIGTSLLYRLDTQAPADPVVDGPTGPSSTTTVTWTWTGDTTAVATCQLVRDALVVEAWQRCSTSERRTLAQDGRWVWQVRLTDGAGNVAGPVDSPVYVLDTRAPEAPSVSTPASPSSSRTPSFVISGEDRAVVTCRVLHAGTVLQDWRTCERTVTLDLTSGAEGSYRVEARLTDAAGNRSLTGSSQNYVLDTVAPVVPVITGATGDSSSSRPTWSWTAEAGASSECSLVRSDGLVVDWTGCSSAYTPVLPAEGAWRLLVRVRDAARNVSGTATGPEYRYDATAPLAPAVTGPASPGRSRTPAWTFTGEAGTTASCMLTGPDRSSAWAPCTSPHVTDLTGRAQGTYRLDVRLRDAAGNLSALGQAEYQLDTVAPTAASVVAPPSPSVQPAVTWTLLVDEAGLRASCTLLRDGKPVDGGACAVDTLGTTWSADLAPRGDGLYRLQVLLTDLAGNVSAPAGADYVYDTSPPAAVAVAAPLSPGSSRTPTWRLTAEPLALIECRLGERAFSPCGATGSYTPDLTSSPDGAYSLTVRATDRAGNVGPSTTTTYVLDTEQPLTPVVTGPLPSPGSQRTPVWTWTAEPGSAATCSLARGTRVVFAGICASSLTVRLPADGTYLLSVTATDAAGNASLPGTASYTLDTTAPDLPVIVGPSSPSSIADPVFGFDAEEGALVECRRSSGPSATSLVVDDAGWTSCPDGVLTMQLVVEQTYRVEVRATDAAGNTSAAARYDYVYDRSAPAGLTDLVLPTSPGNVVRPVWGFTAPVGATTTCRLSGPNGVVETAPCSGGFRPAEALTVEGRHVLRIVVRDVNGNVGTNDLLYVLDLTGPAAPAVTPVGAVGRVGQVQWGWTGDPTATWQCQLEHGGRVVQTWQGCEPGVQLLGQWGDGTYVLSVRGVDKVGNAGGAGRGSYTWRSAGPAALGVTTTSPTTGGPGPVLWTFPVPDDAAVVTCGVRRDGVFVSGPVACRGSYVMNLSGLRDGGYEVVVRFADLVGNTTEQVRSYVLSSASGPARPPVAPPPSSGGALRSPNEGGSGGSGGSGGGGGGGGGVVPLQRTAGPVTPLLPAGTPPVDRAPRQPLGLGDGTSGLGPVPADPPPPAAAPRPGLALDGGRLSGAAAVEAIRDVATQTIKRPELPLALLLLVLAFLLVQNRIDHRDPKLAAAPGNGDDELEFRPLRTTAFPRVGGAPA